MSAMEILEPKMDASSTYQNLVKNETVAIDLKSAKKIEIGFGKGPRKFRRNFDSV